MTDSTLKSEINTTIGALELASKALKHIYEHEPLIEGAREFRDLLGELNEICKEIVEREPKAKRQSLLEASAGVLIKYKADTSEAKRAIKELSDEERAFAQERLAAIEAGNQALDDQMRRWQALAATVNAATGAVEIARKALTAYATEALKLGAEEVAAIALGKKPLDDE